MLVDTGCDWTMVSEAVVEAADVNWDKKTPVLCVHGDTVHYPTAKVRLNTVGWSDEKEVVVAPHLPVPVLLGRDSVPREASDVNQGLAVVTRSKARQASVDAASDSGGSGGQDQRGKENGEAGDMTHSGEEELHATPGELRQWQQADPTLTKARENAVPEPDSESRVFFYYKDGLLYRRWRPQASGPDDVRSSDQLVLPHRCRQLVLRLAHDVPMAGHLGVTKMKDRILLRYYWPGIFKEVADYCRSCEVCQRSHLKKPARAGLVPMPVMSKPFHRIAMDIVGPLPRTQRGNRFILTIRDYATRYPEAIALPSTEATRIARELIVLFSRMGIPEEILTDQGTNFMSALLEEVYRMLHIKRIRTTPYHPQTDGLVERFNGTLKS